MPKPLWKKWQSWNPAWRPKGARSVETLFREAIDKLAKDLDIEDVERDLVITILAKAKKGDLKAMEMYLDRMYGKPKQKIETTGDVNVELTEKGKEAVEYMLGLKNSWQL